MHNVVDTSGWLEYMTNGPLSNLFAPAVENTHLLIVPTVSVLEVFRWVLRERGESDALRATAMMQQGVVVDLDAALALKAAKLGNALKLPLADSVIYATAREFNAVLWTQDAHFAGLPGVEYHPKYQPPKGAT
ncbi:MAG: type II toxin-antitoxin system VapC family toxin [Gemmatimonadetes bacterium]|nr:type II toxin-antitoxin system VapC family toxin [Gemmatimonadota bacterium]